MDQVTKLKIQTFQVIDTKEGLVLRRGNEQILLRSAGSLALIRILQTEIGPDFLTLESLIERFPETEYSDVFAILKEMISRRFILTYEEGQEKGATKERNEDVFFWQFGETRDSFLKKLHDQSICLVGVNILMQKIREVLVNYGVREVVVLDHPELENNSYSLPGEKELMHSVPYQDWESQCSVNCSPLFIIGSEFGGPFLMSEINTYCIENGIRFMPVYLRNMIGYVGSVIVPGRTPCIKCLLGRHNAHLLLPEIQTIADKFAFEGQHMMAWHPGMLNVLAETAGFEVMRYIGELHTIDYGELIEIDMIGRTTRNRKILKLPRCPVCSTTRKVNPYDIYYY
jgi:hypothetical protein